MSYILKFSNKAKTLQKLNLYFKKKIDIPNFLFFTKKEILKNDDIIKKVLKRFKNSSIIMRSSALDEDNYNNSNAGKYDSVIIKNPNIEKIKNGLKKIFVKLKLDKDIVLFQKFLIEPDISGVVFTRDINTNAPYYVINFDKSKRTNLITSGKKSVSQETLNILKKSLSIPREFQKLLDIISKIEKVSKNDRLDIEFAIKNKKVFIFQVRPLKKAKKINEKLFYGVITNLEKKIEKILSKDPSLSGQKNTLSNMSDWNPAEMIGSKPTKLSFSLYSELITDKVWAEQRKLYGYKYVSPNRLMIDLAGSPYIDLRTDFNSFLPANTDTKTEQKAVNFFIKKIQKSPHLHDKIEFDIVPTCFNFSTKNYLKKFLNLKEQKKYIANLKNINKEIINDNNENIFYNDIKKIEILDKKLKEFKKEKISPIQKIFFLVDLCKNYGTLPFSGIARSAFVATSILRDLQKKFLITDEELANFYSDINTITNELNKDLSRLELKKINKIYFIKKYGHLRPSTYSISSKNYKEGFNFYFSNKRNSKKIQMKNKQVFRKNYIKKVNTLLNKEKLKINFNQLIKFAAEAIKQREYSKYIFTKAIDEIFTNLKILGKEVEINFNDLEHISIKTILEAYNNLSVEKLGSFLKKEINKNKKFYKISSSIKLPDVIISSKDVFFHKETQTTGNFITRLNVTGKIKILNKKNLQNAKVKLDNQIIFIENADPGFDFIFYHNIKGLVTKYGGSNSHMAIRCMELGIPAVIGLGEKKYDFFSQQSNIQIDCQNKIIQNLIK
jgi:glutamine kinase